jgi:acetyl esterase/lipase
VSWSWAFLGVTVFGAVFVLNAFRPLGRTYLAVPSFFAGWYTGELPVWHIVWQVGATLGFAFTGALGYWPGWIGLGVAVCSWVGLGVLAWSAHEARHVFVRAEEEFPLPPAQDAVLPVDGSDTMWHFPRIAYPLARPVRSASVLRNLDYGGDGRYRHRLDVIRRREDPPARAPVLLHVHGGAWVLGDKREQGFPLMYELARRGWVCVTINYRLSPRATWPDQIVDCKRAVSWVRGHIEEYGGDPGFVAVTGGSAGGHLSALLALSAGDPAFQPGFELDDSSVAACVPMYGVYDMTCGRGEPNRQRNRYDDGLLRLLERHVFKERIDDHLETFVEASPLYRVRRDAPPFFVIHGANDTLVPVSTAREFVGRLRSVSSSPVVYAEMPLTQHAFDVLPSVRSSHAVAAIVRFLEAVRHDTLGSAGAEPTAAGERAGQRT